MRARLCIALLGPLVVAGASRAAEGPLKAFFERHCHDCHSGATPEAGLDLAAMPRDFSAQATLKRFVRIHDRIAKGEMPPAEVERPSAADVATVTTWLDTELHAADAARIEKSGRARMRRLTRSEFEQTLRDLLALDRLDIQSLVPEDGRVAGYDTIADGLDLSGVYLAASAAAVEKALDAAIATRSTPPPVFRRRVFPASLVKFGGNLTQGNFVLLKDRQPDPALPLRGGYEEVEWYISAADADADMAERNQLFRDHKITESTSSVGLLVPNLAGYEAAMNVAPIWPGRYRLRLSLWGFQWNKGVVEPSPVSQAAVLRAHAEGQQQEGGRLLGTCTAASLTPREHEITTWLDAHESIVFDPVSIPWRGLQVRQIGGRTKKHVGPGVALDWFEVEGPLNKSWPPESHRRLFGDLPIAAPAPDSKAIPPRREPIRQTPLYLPAFQSLSPEDRNPLLQTVQSTAPVDDARRLFGAFLPQAFRRPVEAGEIDPYVTLVEERLAGGDCFEDAMRRAYVAILTSPEFLFLPADLPAAGGADLFALASRLSYWLWNSPPDERLRAAAEDGSLATPAVLHAQIDRLLDDPRSGRFIDDFADQWLELRRIDETSPDRQLYPEYSFLLHEGMVAETRAFLRELIANDLPSRNLVAPDFTMLTQRLAEHYGIQGVDGVNVRRVSLLQGSHRGGLLAQAAIHKLTADGTTTSPVKRGVWIMDRLFDDPPPPPPPGIAGVDPDTRGVTTIRDQLAKHRSDASCAACHAKIDPPGFALECFDPVGGYRDRYRSTGKGDPAPKPPAGLWFAHYKLGPTVDASGMLADGRPFAGVDDLKAMLAADPRPLARAFAAHMIRYATAADISYADRRTIEHILDAAAPTQYGLRSLIHAIAASPLVATR
jgi:mono/diheme cytochrome c family protein